MDGPINYNIDVKNPFQEYVKGLQLGAAAKQIQAQQAQETEMQSTLQSLSDNPTPEGLLKASIRYPELSAHLSNVSKGLSETEHRAFSAQIAPVFHAVTMKNFPVAAQALTQQSMAYANAGKTADAESAAKLAKMLQGTPEEQRAAVSNIQLGAMSILGPEEFAKVSKIPAELLKGQAEATTAAINAKYGEQEKLLAQQKTSSDMQNTAFDQGIKSRQTRISELDYLLKDQTNTQAQEKYQAEKKKLEAEQAQLQKDRTATGKRTIIPIESLQETLKDVMDTPNDVVDAATGPFNSSKYSPSLRASTIKFQKTLELARNKATLTQLQNMKGNISDSDREFLSNGVAILDPKLDPVTLKQNVANLARITDALLATEREAYGITNPVLPPRASDQNVPVEWVRDANGKPVRKNVGAK